MICGKLTKKQRWAIAEKLAEDRLPGINQKCEEIHSPKTFYSVIGKRIIDIVISSVVLVITLPINVILGLLTLFDVGLPIFFKQERIGKNGRSFYIVKFRNMRIEFDEHGEMLPPEQRMTRFGRFMRKTSLDELLNFWSILKGDMSIIGPRPLVPEYTHRYSKRHKMRLSVRPGLECPPRSALDHVWDWDEQFENDVWYVENVSFKTDLHMVVQLIRFALDKKSANARAMVSRGTFMGYSEDGRAINMDEVPETYINAVSGLGG